MDGVERALIFGTHEILRHLTQAKYWVADETFETGPGLFRQQFTIEGSTAPSHESAFSLMYVPMINKSEILYREALSKLVEVADEIDLDLNHFNRLRERSH